MTTIPPAVESLIGEGRPAHLVTLEPDGRPQITGVWMGVEGDEIVSGHLDESQRKPATAPDGFVTRIAVDRISGSGDWTS